MRQGQRYLVLIMAEFELCDHWTCTCTYYLYGYKVLFVAYFQLNNPSWFLTDTKKSKIDIQLSLLHNSMHLYKKNKWISKLRFFYVRCLHCQKSEVHVLLFIDHHYMLGLTVMFLQVGSVTISLNRIRGLSLNWLKPKMLRTNLGNLCLIPED